MARKRTKQKGPARKQTAGVQQRAGRHAGPTPADQAAAAAVAQLNSGNTPAAINIIEQGLRAAPEHPDLLHLAGQLTLMRGNQEQGRELVERAVANAPDIALFRLTLGNVYVVDRELDKALAEYRRALRINPRLADAHTNIGITLARQGHQEEAMAALQNAARLDPDNPQAHLNLAVCSAELRRPDQAAVAIHRVEELVSDPPAEMLHQIGNIYRALGMPMDAQDFYRRALEKRPDEAGIWYALGEVRSLSGEHEPALSALDEAERHGYPQAQLRLAQARVASNRGELGEAKRLLAEALDASGDDLHLLYEISEQYTLLGDFEAQERCLRRSLELDPHSVAAFAGLAFAPGRQLSDSDAQRLRRLAEDPSVDAGTRVRIGFSLGNYYHYAKRYEEAFRYYRLGNRLKGYHFDRGAFAQWVGKMEGQFDPAFFAERSDWGSESTLPLLIVGMPRSGTTLTEQVLSAHSEVYGAGEYGTVAALASVEGLPIPDFRHNPELASSLDRDAVARHAAAYLDRVQPLALEGERFVTNKLPYNFLHLGLFGLLFPRAPVVHVRRDPRDTLLSIYFQDFTGLHDYAYDLKALGLYYRQYERLVAHWMRVIPNPVYSLTYEELVADLPGKSRELADFIGVPWEEAMLKFFEQDRLVHTASKWQVRQKLYTTSVGRWKPYEKYLKPLFDVLGPMD